MTEMPAPAEPSFAARYAQALVDAGWRVALHLLPYALLAGIVIEMILRLRIAFIWKLPLVLGAIGCLHLAVMLGAYVATLRRLARQGAAVPPARHHVGAAWRITLETAVVMAVVLLGGLALTGAIDVTIAVTEASFGDRWPWMLARAVATATALAVIAVLLTGATALAGSSAGGVVSFPQAAIALHRRSTQAAAIICVVISVGTVATVAGFLLAQGAGVWPPAIAAGLGKALGLLGATTVLSVGAATFAAES
ncbi:hypothetical protein [Phreatobacter stygius]|uniref:Uncharacterized protein n=1 Tax=Phreatobacter stygius TaxID=1940610 RepID=A0A4D7B3N4_9HYPH|nr:hypothetical protein [Phreatobacter stygius]QCI64236.1 hypothetical protein E8M01_08250 [Phreatobacter stygius]